VINLSAKRVLGLVGGAVLATGMMFPAAAEMAPGDVMIKDGAVSSSLTGQIGSTATGIKAFKNRKQGNCLSCHVNSDMTNEPYHGEVGPSLDGVADRYSEAELRAILVNSKAVLGEDTIMPAFYTVQKTRVAKKFVGKTILTAEQVEGLVTYLMSLKE